MFAAAAAPALEAPMTDLEKAYASIDHTELAGLGFIGGRSTVWTADELVRLRSPPPAHRIHPKPYATDCCRYILGVYRVGGDPGSSEDPSLLLL